MFMLKMVRRAATRAGTGDASIRRCYDAILEIVNWRYDIERAEILALKETHPYCCSRTRHARKSLLRKRPHS